MLSSTVLIVLLRWHAGTCEIFMCACSSVAGRACRHVEHRRRHLLHSAGEYLFQPCSMAIDRNSTSCGPCLSEGWLSVVLHTCRELPLILRRHVLNVEASVLVQDLVIPMLLHNRAKHPPQWRRIFHCVASAMWMLVSVNGVRSTGA